MPTSPEGAEARAATLARAGRDGGVFAISAVTGEGLDALLRGVGNALQDARHETCLHLRFDEGRRRAWLYEQDLVREETQTETGFDITVQWSARQEERFAALRE